VLGVVTDRAALESALAGWPEAMDAEGSMQWVKDRVASVATPPA
jgi:hypothetical protein